MSAECASRLTPASTALTGKYLVVNADDFGISTGVNAGIMDAHRHGIVTSASLMVHRSAARDAVEKARRFPALGVGLHLDFGEWRHQNGEWIALYERVSLDDAEAVRNEIMCQLELFETLAERLPTHVDSHQHVHRNEPVRTLILQVLGERGIPLRDLTPGLHYCGDFYGQTGTGDPLPECISVGNLTRLLSELSPGVTELSCHPGFDDQLQTAYAVERRREVAALCSQQVRAMVESQSIFLVSFADVRPYLFA